MDGKSIDDPPPPKARQAETRTAVTSEIISRRKRAQREEYRDAHGVAFDNVRYVLGDRRNWPRVNRVSERPACQIMHQLFSACWECGDTPQAHHMFAGSAGKTEELCNIAMLCAKHHGERSATILPLGRVLYLKWKFDPMHVSWCRLTLLYGSWLPDLITSKP